MKKIGICAVAVMLVLSMCACGKKTPPAATKPTEHTPTAPATVPTVLPTNIPDPDVDPSESTGPEETESTPARRRR